MVKQIQNLIYNRAGVIRKGIRIRRQHDRLTILFIWVIPKFFWLATQYGSILHPILVLWIEKVRFTITKLTKQANQYWADVERIRKIRFQSTIETWKYMKNKFMGKYVPPFYIANFLDKLRRITQNNKSTKGYIIEFDKSLTHYNIWGMQSDV